AARAATPVAELVARIASVLRRTPDGERLDWAIDAPAELAVALDPADLSEALGALAENAARHAASRVAITARQSNGRVRIEIRDDGPGIPDDALASIAGRGRRLDEDRQGAGLGLSIAGEIAAAAGGTLSLENGLPGLRAVLDLPAAATG
ncbi:MAG: ATP-binding protein, partial [Nitratireductor sp.]